MPWILFPCVSVAPAPHPALIPIRPESRDGVNHLTGDEVVFTCGGLETRSDDFAFSALGGPGARRANCRGLKCSPLACRGQVPDRTAGGISDFNASSGLSAFRRRFGPDGETVFPYPVVRAGPGSCAPQVDKKPPAGKVENFFAPGRRGVARSSASATYTPATIRSGKRRDCRGRPDRTCGAERSHAARLSQLKDDFCA